MRKKQKKKAPVMCFKRWKRKSYAAFASVGKTIKIGVLCVGYSMLTLNATASAAKGVAADTTDDGQSYLLDEIVVAGERPPQFMPLMQVVAVIQRSDIERAAVQNLQDLLRYVDGIDLRVRGNNQVQADLSIRGGTFDQTVVLLNGVNLSDPQTGHYSLDLPLPLEHIVRIELLQGPGAWCAGAVAYGGAVNIITALPEQSGVSAGISTGAHDFQNTEIAAAYSRNRWRMTASASHSKSSGYAPNTDYAIGNVYAQTRYATKRHGTLDGQFGYQQKDYGANSFYTPAYPNQFEHTDTWLGSVRYHLERKRWGLAATAYFRDHYDRYELVRSAPPYNFHRTDIAGALLQLNGISRWGTTTAGLNYRYEHIFSNKLGEPMAEPIAVRGEGDAAWYTQAKTREHVTGFVQHTFRLRTLQATLGGMCAGNNDYGFHGYAGLNLSYTPLPAWQLTAALHNSYRLPTFTDLFYTSPSQQGNPNLQPEEAWNSELAAHFRRGSWHASATGFYRYGYRMIDWLRAVGETKWYAQNLTDIQYCGSHLLLEYAPQRFFLQKAALRYEYLYMQPKAGEMESNYAVDYLQHRLVGTWQHGIWRHLSAAWQCTYAHRAGTYLNYPAQNETAYRPYWLCDVKLYWQAPAYTLFVEATNLFNAAYADVANVPQPGRWLKVGIRVRVF